MTISIHRKVSSLARTVLALAVMALMLASHAIAQVPQLINYQGRVVVGSTDFNGNGSFAFALVNSDGTTTYWSNDGTSVGGSQPLHAVSLTVTRGLYSVLLGDSSNITNMTVIPASVFANGDVRLRVWFNDGTHDFQMLTPDQRIAAVGYATSGQLGTLTSSRRFKTDIQDMGAASSALLSLRPVTFRYKPEIDPAATPQFGLVAEEVAKVDPALVVRDDKNQVYTVRYEAVNAMLLNEFQKQHKEIEALKAELKELKGKLPQPQGSD